MPQVDEVWLVLSWHAKQPQPIKELSTDSRITQTLIKKRIILEDEVHLNAYIYTCIPRSDDAPM